MGIVDDTIRRREQIDASIAKFDAGRLRSLAGVMVSNLGNSADPEPVLVDVAALDWGEVVAAYADRVRKFSTAPFDREGSRFRMYPGGVTIWSGYPGTGKTTLLRQLACHLLHCGHGVFFASFEEDPQDLLVRLVQSAAGTETPTAAHGEWFGFSYADKLKVWGVIGVARHRQVVGAIQNLAKTGQITHAIIDSLMCLDIGNDDFEDQRRFAALLAATARALKIHIHLVAHPRKSISSDQEPDLNDVAGAREIGGIADNVVFVRRGQRQDDGGTIVPMRIAIRKQRHGSGAHGEITGFFNRSMKQFHIGEFDQVTRYLPNEAYG